MWKLTKHFTFGAVLGGMAVSFISSVLLRHAEAAFWQLAVGYIAFSCLASTIYGGGLKMLGLPARVEPAVADLRRSLGFGAGCVVVEYAVTLAAVPDLDRVMLFAAPFSAAIVEAMRARRLRRQAAAAETEAEAGR